MPEAREAAKCKALAWWALLAISPAVRAGAVVELTVTDRGTLNEVTGSREGFHELTGPFPGGAELLVHVMVTATQSFDVRAAQVDWRASSSALDLGADIDTGFQTIDGVGNFWFDYTGGPTFGTFPARGSWEADPVGHPGELFDSTGGYLDVSNLLIGDNLDVPWAPNTTFLAAPGAGQMRIDASIPFHLGAMPVVLPAEEGSYTLDLLNPTVLDSATAGFFLAFGFGESPGDPIRLWSTAVRDERVDDVIAYADGAGPVVFAVVPEPVSLSLLALGAVVAWFARRYGT